MVHPPDETFSVEPEIIGFSRNVLTSFEARSGIGVFFSSILLFFSHFLWEMV